MMSKIQLTTKHNLKAEKQLKNNILPSSEGGDQLGKTSMKKKNIFFRALPELPNPPPPDPNSGNLVLFFWKSKFKIWKSV